MNGPRDRGQLFDEWHRRGRASTVTPATELRPGEQVQIDTTCLDVLALFDDRRLARLELIIAIHAATRPVLTAMLCTSAIKAVDATLFVAVTAARYGMWYGLYQLDALFHARFEDAVRELLRRDGCWAAAL
ncbi:hypothetical protein [Streptomyces collinus]|uniref:hypothetical protein n=1 Tax=Streptomyces collinus TaxID=42684 RepID=UPI0036D02BDB